MPLSNIQEHAKSIFRAFFFYRRGFLYLYMRYIVAPRIFSFPHSLEKPQTRSDFSMHMFVGRRDFLMGLWSVASLYRVAREIGELVVHSDGSLGEKEEQILRRLFPSLRFENSKDFLRLHGATLAPYPELKKFRETYKRFQVRIVDQHFLSGKPLRMFIDSDLLWFTEPVEITAAVQNGIPVPLMMSNAGFVRMTLKDGTETDGATSRPNGGLVLYNEQQFIMNRCVEFLQKSDYVEKRFGDQAWMAWVLRPELLPEDRYIIKGAVPQDVVMRHYTAPQREKFFCYGLNFIWKDILNHVRN